MNRLSTYLLPTTAALALAAGGYIIWEHWKNAIRERTVNPRYSGVVEAKFSDVEIPGEQAEETAIKQEDEEEVQGGENTLLLQQYDWNAYTKAPPPVGALYEAMLLSSFLLNLGTTLNQEETSKVLMANAGLRKTLLECWETGRLDLLRRHDTIVALLEGVSHRQDKEAGALPASANTADEESQSNTAPAVTSERDSAAATQGGSHGKKNSVPSSPQLGREDKERGARDEEGAREKAIQQGDSGDHMTETKCLEDANAVIIQEVPTKQIHLDGRTLGGRANTTFNSQGIEIYDSVFNDVKGDQNFYTSDHHRKVAKWYSPTDYKMTHHDISKKRANDTGVWLLESEVFKQWETDPNCRILWCPGIPGVGKTTIASLVIDHLRQLRSETVAVGFAYFNYKLQHQQSTTTVLECLCRQLYEVYQGKGASSSLEAFYETNQKDHPHPPAAGLHPTLSSTCRRFQQYYIVLDALDEYLEIYSIATLGELLRGLTTLGSSVKLLVTSRILGGMEELFREFGAVREDITAKDEDMSIYIRNRIRTPGFCPGISDELSGEIVEKVKEAAGGRFLMAELHMNTLAGQLNPGFLKRVLANLPHNIDATYERVLQRFKTYQDSHRELAMMTLAWVTCAKRRLSVKALQHALATEPGLENIEDYMTPMSTITSLCAGLVIVRDGSVIFAHFTAQDFFETPRIQSEYFPNAEASLLKTCLAYISLPLCIETYQNGDRWWSISDTIPFYDYAAQNLGIHAQGQAEGASRDLDVFLSSNTTIFNQCCRHMQTSDYGSPVRDFPPDFTISAVFVAIYYNRVAPLQNLLYPLNDVPLMLEAETPLMYAARIGRTVCLRAMLHWSQTRPDIATLGLLPDNQKIQSPLLVGNINRTDRNGFTALLHACAQGQEEAVGLLLNHQGTNVNLADSTGRTPLSRAAGEGHEGVVELLLNHKGIDVNLAELDGWTPLTWAAARSHEGVGRLLINHEGIEVNPADNNGRTPSSHGVGKGQEGVVGLLLNHEGINVNLADNRERTPLSHAVEGGHEGVVVLLLNHEGIDVNLADNNGRTPVSHGVGKGQEGVVGLLLNHEGINVNLADNRERTPLSHAAEGGYEGVVGLLLNHKGIDINLADKEGRTPLSHAAQFNREGVVGLLLNHKGINVNLADEEGRTPLSFAAEWSRKRVVGLLLNHEGIDINLAESDGRTPLIYAAVLGHEVVVGLLLNHEGIDVNPADYHGWTPLFFAANWHRETVTRYLLRHPEIQLNRQDAKGATALTRTIIDWNGNNKFQGVHTAKPVIQLLLSRDDLDINLADNEGHTPLFYAQRAAKMDKQWEDVCVLLRARGAVAELDWADFVHYSLFPQLFGSSTFFSDS